MEYVPEQVARLLLKANKLFAESDAAFYTSLEEWPIATIKENHARKLVAEAAAVHRAFLRKKKAS